MMNDYYSLFTGRRRYNNLMKQTIIALFLPIDIILFLFSIRFTHDFIDFTQFVSMDKAFVDSHRHQLELC